MNTRTKGVMMNGRIWAGVGAGAAAVVLAATPAMACGGLVGENGTIQLVRTSTLAAYHDGVERYVVLRGRARLWCRSSDGLVP